LRLRSGIDLYTTGGFGVKKKELERFLRWSGWWLLRQGGSHEIWTDGVHVTPVPRKKELKEGTARSIMKEILLYNVRT
jgi:mRNA interferase HicA